MDSLDDDIPTLIDHTTDKEVPLTIITGFLGSGKSTFLNHILTARHGHRIAVILNEFGDTADIESKTISVSSKTNDSSKENVEDEETHILELPNGCLCCSIKDTGVAAIEQLMAVQGKFDHILLECSGLADPGPIARTFWHNEEYLATSNIVLDSVVCVVDGVFAEEQIKEEVGRAENGDIGEWTRQVLSSDTILISKSDLLDASSTSKTEKIRQSIQSLNPGARIFSVIRGVLQDFKDEQDGGLDKILGVRAYASLPSLPSAESSHTHEKHDPAGQPCDCNDSSHSHLHTNGITSLTLPLPLITSEASFDQLDAWIRSVLWEDSFPTSKANAVSLPQVKVLRAKGLILRGSSDASSEVEEWVLQGVRSLYDVFRAGQRDALQPQGNGKIVLIGNFAGVNTDDAKRNLDDWLAEVRG